MQFFIRFIRFQTIKPFLPSNQNPNNMKKAFATIAITTTVFFAFSQNSDLLEIENQATVSSQKARLINDTVWLLDSTLNQQNTDSGFIDRERSISLAHDTEGRITSKITQYMNIITQVWTNRSYDSVIFYPGSNIVSEKFYAVWNTNENNWKTTIYRSYADDGRQLLAYDKNWDNTQNHFAYGYQQIWEYNESGKLAVYSWEEFNSEIQDFEDYKRQTYSYNDLNQVATIINEKWNPENQAWNNTSRNDFLYNEFGNASRRTNLSWNTSSQEWNNYSKSDFTYTDSGLISNTTNQLWDSELPGWKNDTQSTLSYNSQNLNDTTTYYFWLDDKEIWYPSYRQMRDYNAQDIMVELIRQDCFFPADNFENSTRLLNIYENNLRVEERVQKWTGTNWRDDRIQLFTYVYDTLFESQTIISYDTYNQVYDTSYRYLAVYNDKPLLEKVLTQHWNSENAEFSTSRQTFYFWSPLASPDAIFEVEQLDFMVYPNPSSGIFKINLPEETENNSRIIVSDLNGRIIYSGFTESRHTNIDLSREKKGIYHIQIISGTKRGVRQVIKF